jgi:hypothetical protein
MKKHHGNNQNIVQALPVIKTALDKADFYPFPTPAVNDLSGIIPNAATIRNMSGVARDYPKLTKVGDSEDEWLFFGFGGSQRKGIGSVCPMVIR